MKQKLTILVLALGLGLLQAETYKVGDQVADFTDSLCTQELEWSLYDHYGDLNGGDYKVVWLVFFNKTSRRCQLEAAYTQAIHDMYKDQGLITIGVGSGWNNSYDCKDWAKDFGVTYPIINDDRLNLRSLFADSSVPHHVIIDHNMQIHYTEKGTIMPPLGNEFLISLNSALNNMSVLSIDDSIIPKSHTLNACYPNPFNNSTTISYELSEETNVNINVIDLQGRTQHSILRSNKQSPGHYSFSWNADQFSSGVYFIELVTENMIQHQKVLLVK